MCGPTPTSPIRAFPTRISNGVFNTAAVPRQWPGTPGQIVLVRAFYKWTLVTLAFLTRRPAATERRGQRSLQAASLFRLEERGPTSQGQAPLGAVLLRGLLARPARRLGA